MFKSCDLHWWRNNQLNEAKRSTGDFLEEDPGAEAEGLTTPAREAEKCFGFALFFF